MAPLFSSSMLRGLRSVGCLGPGGSGLAFSPGCTFRFGKDVLDGNRLPALPLALVCRFHEGVKFDRFGGRDWRFAASEEFGDLDDQGLVTLVWPDRLDAFLAIGHAAVRRRPGADAAERTDPSVRPPPDRKIE